MHVPTHSLISPTAVARSLVPSLILIDNISVTTLRQYLCTIIPHILTPSVNPGLLDFTVHRATGTGGARGVGWGGVGWGEG